MEAPDQDSGEEDGNMLQWQHLFPTAVVQRGREYYKKNLVRSLIRDGETYYAAVQGTQEYQVTVHLRAD